MFLSPCFSLRGQEARRKGEVQKGQSHTSGFPARALGKAQLSAHGRREVNRREISEQLQVTRDICGESTPTQ